MSTYLFCYVAFSFTQCVYQLGFTVNQFIALFSWMVHDVIDKFSVNQLSVNWSKSNFDLLAPF